MPGGTNWRLAKGKQPPCLKSRQQLWLEYYGFWCQWAELHPVWMMELRYHATVHGKLSDRFASSEINQARALSQWLNSNPVYPRM